MKTTHQVVIGIMALLCLASATADTRSIEQADQIKRDAQRLEGIKTVALAPVVIQLRFDKDNRLPDANRMAARNAVATRLPAILEEKMHSGKYTLLPTETLTLGMKQANLQPTALYITNTKGSWEAPSETISNKKGDEVVLLNELTAMRQTPDEMTLFRYKWHDLPEMVVGLAAFKDLNFARPDVEKIKMLGTKYGADAVLLCQVEDMETHEGAGLFNNYKSTRIHLHSTLVASSDGAVLWQAHARGLKSQQAGFFTLDRAYKGEDRKAIEGAVQATQMLLDDLNSGAGKPIAK